MPRSPSTYSLPPGTTPQVPNTVISSSMFTAFADDVAQTFNTVQPIAYGGTGVSDLKLNDTDFGIKDNADPTKIGQFNASGLPTGTTRTYDLPYYSGTLGLVSDIRGQIYGLTLSNDAGDPTNDVGIAAGAAVDSTGTVSMLLPSSLIKRLDAAWAVGTNQGMLDSGSSPATSTWYSIFLIRRPDTNVVDVLASTSATAPTLPTNYTQFRRIGSVYNDSAGDIKQFFQFGDRFIWVTPDIGAGIVTNPGTSAVLQSVRAPQGVGSVANLSVQLFDGSASGYTTLYLSPTASNNTAPSTSSPYTLIAPLNTGASVATTNMDIFVDAATQIRARLSASDADVSYVIQTNGYLDFRGQF